MKQTKLYNYSLPKEILDKTRLKKGEVVVYRLANLQRDPMNPEKWAIPYQVNVAPTDTYFDQSANEYHPIAAVKSVISDGKTPEGQHVFHDIFFTKQNAGLVVLKGGNAEHQEIHSYLALSNRNISNKNRDASVEGVFELVDEVAKAVESKKKRNSLRDAMNAAADMKPQEVKDFVASIGGDDKRDIVVLRDEVEEYATKNPTEFLLKFNNKQNIIKATLKRASDSGVILFKAETSSWYWGTGEVIVAVARTAGTDHLEGLLEFVISSKKGEAVYQDIIKLSKQ